MEHPQRELAKILSQAKYVNAPVDDIESRLLGIYDLGIGKHTYKNDYMVFFKGGEVPFPRKSYAIFFLAQYRRWGMVKEKLDYKGITDKIVMQNIYVKVAKDLGIPIPKDDMKPLSGFIDGVIFDPKNPEGSISKYKTKEV